MTLSLSLQAVSDFQNQEHFLTRKNLHQNPFHRNERFDFIVGIGVGGLINTRKIELVNMVLKDVAMFHNRHRRQPLFKCCHDLNRFRLSTASIMPDIKEKHAATVCVATTEASMDR